MLITVSIVLVLGVIGRMLSNRTGFPGIVFYLLFGVMIGPEVLDLIHPSEFERALEVAIKLCVAIVLFEAGLNMNRKDILSHGKMIMLLITVGGVITMVGAAALAYFLCGIRWELALLYGSLVIVTGPTVVQPLLRKFKVKSSLNHILEYEGVLIDPIGALVALFVVNKIIHLSSGVGIGADHASYGMEVAKTVLFVCYKFVLGGVVGLSCGYAVSWIIKRFYVYMEDFVDLFVLAFAIAIYEAAEVITPEAGLVAAIVSGAIIGNMNIPEEEETKKFKGKLAVLVISLLFIFLAANLEFDYITGLGINGFLVVAGLLFIVRPVQIFLLSMHSGLSSRDKTFLSFVSPRGIVAASIASIIAIELKEDHIEGANVVQGLVFLTIAVSVFLQGSTGSFVSRALGVVDHTNKVVVVGANELGRLLARLFGKIGQEVCIMDSDSRLVDLSVSEGLNAVEGNSLTMQGFEKTNIVSKDAFVTITTSDHVNILSCRLARTDFKVGTVCALLNKHADSAEIKNMHKFRIPAAFGKAVDAADIYSKILEKKYAVWRFRATKHMLDQVGHRDHELFPEHLVPLVVERRKMEEVLVYHQNVRLEADDLVYVLDLEPLSPNPGILEKSEKEPIEV